MPTSLDQLKAAGTTVVSDSGDFETIGKYKPQDATTNPSLILAASKKTEYAKLMDIAVKYGKEHVRLPSILEHHQIKWFWVSGFLFVFYSSCLFLSTTFAFRWKIRYSELMTVDRVMIWTTRSTRPWIGYSLSLGRRF